MDAAVLGSQEVSGEMLAKLFKDAYFDVTLDPKGGVIVKEDLNYYLNTDKERGLIRYHCPMRSSQASEEARLKYVNSVNAKVIMLRASALEKMVVFDYWLVTQGGIAPGCIIMAFKRFASCVRSAIQADSEKVLG